MEDRRIHRELVKEGEAVCVRTVAAIMREQDLVAVQSHAYKVTTQPDGEAHQIPDLIEQDFSCETPGEKLVGDITYLRTGQGWLYLVTVIDLATRMVVGWSMATGRCVPVSSRMRPKMASQHGYVADQAIFHSRGGVASTPRGEFGAFCRAIGVRQTMGRVGTCYDKWVAEPFFATLKKEMYHRYRFPTIERARFAVAQYIELFYNRKRSHSTNNYRTPYEAWTEHQKLAQGSIKKLTTVSEKLDTA